MLFLALLLCGYSVFSAPVLALTHFRSESYAAKSLERALGMALVLALGGLQWFHFSYLMGQVDGVRGAFYQTLLFGVAPLFYLFSQPLIKAQIRYFPRQALHLLPLILAPWLPFSLAWPLAFVIGAIYLIRLARQVYALRAHRHRFHLELGFLAGIFLIAAGVVILVFLIPLISEKLFFTLYASAIGSAFLLVSLALFHAPQMPDRIEEAARETYASSTLGGVKCEEVLSRLEHLMQQERLFENPDLDLPMMAERLGLSGHQLSELVNVKLGKGFSRHVREYRVNAAKVMLLDEASASVLSIGMCVGFLSQSNFYAAFREVTGMTPGQFRKISTPNSPE